MKTIIYFFQFILINIFFIFGKIIGLKLSRLIFKNIFSILGPVFKSKNTLNNNLITYNHNITDKDKKRIISSMWSNYGMTFIEYVFLDYFRKNNTHIKIFGEKILLNIASKKKPVIFVSGHFANFELMSMEITKKNINLATIYRPLNNIFLNPFMEYLRKKFVCSNQIKKGINGVREAIDYIKKDFSIALMIDQRVSEGEKVEFFGKPALTTTLPAQLALKYNLPIIPVFIERLNNKDFKLKFLEEINPIDYRDKLNLTKKLNQVLEQMILKNPEQWIWTHNRWKM